MQNDKVCPECTEPATGDFCVRCGASLTPESETAEDTQISPPDPETIKQIVFYSASDFPVEARATAETHIGHVKDTNEDAVIARTITWPHHNVAATVLIVADGMGGGQAGETCAELAVGEAWMQIRAILPFAEAQFALPRYEFWQAANARIEAELHNIVSAANSRVFNFGQERRFAKDSYGATFCLLVAFTDLNTGLTHYYGWNEGDARAIVVCGREFKPLTKDHTIDGAPYKFFGKRSYVSGESFSGEITIEPENMPLTFLVYSDGLWNMLSEKQICKICSEKNVPTQTVNALLHAALTVETPDGCKFDDRVTTGDDNISVAMVTISEKE